MTSIELITELGCDAYSFEDCKDILNEYLAHLEQEIYNRRTGDGYSQFSEVVPVYLIKEVFDKYRNER